MLARVRSAAVLGIDAYLVDVETDLANSRTLSLESGSRVKRAAAARRLPQARASTLLSGYWMPTFLMSALKRGSERMGSKMDECAQYRSHPERSS